jgi:hypothetical protein
LFPAVAKNPFPLFVSKYSFQFILHLLEKPVRIIELLVKRQEKGKSESREIKDPIFSPS